MRKAALSILAAVTLAAVAGHAALAAETGAGTDAAAAAETRELLPIPFETRTQLLHKMNQENLGALGRMLDALSRDDLAQVARIANELSYSEKTKKVAPRRGSVAFAVMATDFHGQKMPAIRQAAEKGDRREVLRRMSEAVQTCMSCHAAVRLVEWPDDRAYTTLPPVNLPAGTPQPQYRIPDYQYPAERGARP